MPKLASLASANRPAPRCPWPVALGNAHIKTVILIREHALQVAALKQALLTGHIAAAEEVRTFVSLRRERSRKPDRAMHPSPGGPQSLAAKLIQLANIVSTIAREQSPSWVMHADDDDDPVEAMNLYGERVSVQLDHFKTEWAPFNECVQRAASSVSSSHVSLELLATAVLIAYHGTMSMGSRLNQSRMIETRLSLFHCERNREER